MPSVEGMGKLAASAIRFDLRTPDFGRAGAQALYSETLEMAGWADAAGWEVLLNKRGTTFRKLDEGDKADLGQEKAIALMAQHPTLIKRPVLEHEGGLLVGFKEPEWKDELC